MNFWSYAYTSWSEYGNNELYYKLDRGIQEIFRKQLLQGYVGSQIEQGFPDFIDGLLTGATLTNYGAVRSSLGFSKKGGKQKEGNQYKGTPRNNQAQNKQVNDIVSKYKLNRQQQRELHDEITGQI